MLNSLLADASVTPLCHVQMEMIFVGGLGIGTGYLCARPDAEGVKPRDGNGLMGRFDSTGAISLVRQKKSPARGERDFSGLDGGTSTDGWNIRTL